MVLRTPVRVSDSTAASENEIFENFVFKNEFLQRAPHKKIKMDDEQTRGEYNSSSEDESSSSSEEEEEEGNKNIADPRVEKTVREMLDSRGYETSRELREEEIRSGVVIKSLVAPKKTGENYGGAPDINVIFATDYAGGKKVKFNIENVKNYISYIDSKKLKHALIIHQDKITSRVKDIISNCQTFKKIKIEVFSQADLKFNITKHRLVPRHEAMSKEESRRFKLKYGNKFSGILAADPVVRFYGFEKGDVVKIHRNSGVLVYRIVI